MKVTKYVSIKQASELSASQKKGKSTKNKSKTAHSDPKVAIVQMTPEERREFERDVLKNAYELDKRTKLQKAFEHETRHVSERENY